MKKKRGGYGTYCTSVDVDIDIADVISDMTDDDLIVECGIRGIPVGTPAAIENQERWRDFSDELRSAQADGLHFEVMIVRMLAMAGVPRLRIPVKS